MMSILHTLPQQIAAIMSPVVVNGQFLPRPIDTDAQRRAVQTDIIQIEKSLGLLKKQINDESRLVSEQYTEKSAHVHHNPVVGGVFGREEMKHLSAHEREHIHHQKTQALESYHRAIMHIDQQILMLDQMKARIQQLVPPGPPPPPQMYTYTCHFCGYTFQTPGGLVHCPQCGG